jgi:hypothetical protein
MLVLCSLRILLYPSVRIQLYACVDTTRYVSGGSNIRVGATDVSSAADEALRKAKPLITHISKVTSRLY